MSKDAIYRQAAIDAFWNLDAELRPSAINAILNMLNGLPAVQSERKKGEWTKNNCCPFCGFLPWYENDVHTLSFCPNCGADMRGK